MTQNNNSWRKTYFTLLAGQAISFISSGILQMAIIFYLVAKTNSAIILTAATLIGFLPQACLGPFAGAFVDRHSRKSVMIGADLIIAAAGGILALVAFYMELPVWSIMVVLLIRSAGTAFHSPAFSAATPMIVPKEELTKCAGYTQTMQAVSAIISPAAAAFLYAVWPLNAIILLDIVGAILACVTVAISSIPTPELCPETKRQQFLQDMKEGYVVLKQNRGLFALLWIGVIYMFFYMPLLKTLIFGEEKPDPTELEAGSTTILDILSPTTVDTKSRDYIVVDGVFHTYLYVTGYGYTTTVGSCWLAPLVEAGEGVNMSFLVKRQSKEKILSKISQTTMVNRSRMRDVGDTRQDYEELDSAISSGLYLKDVMNRQGEDFYYMHTLIEVTAPDPETLEQRVTEVEKLCVSVDMIARRCDYKNEQAFLSSLPILALDPDIERKARRNALTSGVAAAFPFASYELSDHNGIFLGLNLYNRSPVFLDPYDDYKYTNGNWWIGGSTARARR